VPAGAVTGDVGIVAAADDVVEAPPPPDALAAVAPLVAAADPVAQSDPVMLGEPGDVVIEELVEPGDDVLLPGVDMLELVNDEGDGRDASDDVGRA
jgi:hypothetical protein